MKTISKVKQTESRVRHKMPRFSKLGLEKKRNTPNQPLKSSSRSSEKASQNGNKSVSPFCEILGPLSVGHDA